MTTLLDRRSTMLFLAGSALSACAGTGAQAKGKLFVGDQRGGSRVVLQGAKRLDSVPYQIIWSEFPNAAPLLEALNAGAIDSGIGGDSAFIFAAGNDAKIKAIGAQATRGMGPVVLVRRDSPIRSLADLAGRKVATPRGSISHNHVLAVLEAYRQPYDAVSFAFLFPLRRSRRVAERGRGCLGDMGPQCRNGRAGRGTYPARQAGSGPRLWPGVRARRGDRGQARAASGLS